MDRFAACEAFSLVNSNKTNCCNTPVDVNWHVINGRALTRHQLTCTLRPGLISFYGEQDLEVLADPSFQRCGREKLAATRNLVIGLGKHASMIVRLACDSSPGFSPALVLIWSSSLSFWKSSAKHILYDEQNSGTRSIVRLFLCFRDVVILDVRQLLSPSGKQNGLACTFAPSFAGVRLTPSSQSDHPLS